MSNNMDEQIRARARGSLDGTLNGADFDAAIRRGSGRAAPAAQTGNAEASDAQLQAARLAGLPDQLAHRLRGEGNDLTADARALVQAYTANGGELVPGVGFDGGSRSAREVGGGPSMDEQIRATVALGRGLGGAYSTRDVHLP